MSLKMILAIVTIIVAVLYVGTVISAIVGWIKYRKARKARAFTFSDQEKQYLLGQAERFHFDNKEEYVMFCAEIMGIMADHHSQGYKFYLGNKDIDSMKELVIEWKKGMFDDDKS